MNAAMYAISAVFYAVAEELAQNAINSMPKLRDGERIQKEWYADGVYYRETVFNGETFTNQYDFRKRECTECKTGDAA